MPKIEEAVPFTLKNSKSGANLHIKVTVQEIEFKSKEEELQRELKKQKSEGNLFVKEKSEGQKNLDEKEKTN